ncbi:dephospho-CoA kinase [Marinitoga lauensis]|uniref:dephospho-CoA kinase n=1 Tax=Marinitoga lauensis TaxID=2201189 RepID=UPI001010D65C|nr:dephospho-CoA kinase [Marinitoga lauensis]
MKIVGITGYAGSGKSTIARILRDVGYVVIDLDIEGHEILKEEEAKNKLENFFGKDIFENDEIRRDKLAKIVFENKNKLELLNSILHPMIKKRVKRKIENMDEEIIFIDGALIEKIGLDEICDYIIFIDSSEEKRLERLVKLRKIPFEKAKNIINSQRNIKYKYNFKIVNNNGLDAIKKELLKILKKI